MCSICGIAAFSDPSALNSETAEAMGRTMKMRGPDDTGTYTCDFAVLNHNRLAVMDVENGHQPMTAVHAGKRYTIVYNGEIYNTKDLKRDLARKGFSFTTACDTEVVLYSYIAYGDECVKHLSGIFAFAIADEAKRSLFIARDRFGIKPFFYATDNGTFLFASEIKGLLAHPAVSPKVDLSGLWQLLFLSPCTIPGSGVFRDIHELKPGFCGTYDQTGLHLFSYWSLRAHPFTQTRDEAVAYTRHLMYDAIRQQLDSDVPLCTFLSGGLDSSIISSVASRVLSERGEVLSTYSFEYEDNKENFHNSLFQPQSDDAYALLMADFCQSDHTVLTAPTGLVASYLLNATIARDIPGQADIDSSLWYFCSQVKKRHTVAISGECSDEIFAGYPWFYRPEMLYAEFFPWIHDPFARIRLFNDSIVKSADGYDFMKSVYRDTLADCPMLDSDLPEDKTARVATVLSTRFFMASLLERKDRMSMASGLEVRVPFADHRILEYVYNVPWRIKFENNTEKALLRNAMAEFLPDEIRCRKKSPYPKTHNPKYETLVTSMLQYRLKKGGILNECLSPSTVRDLLSSENMTWFGQLMGKPQLIAWLVQFDYWFDYYHVQLV